MNIDDKSSTIDEAASFEALNSLSEEEKHILTSTKYSDNASEDWNSGNRRKAIIPTPNKPRVEKILLVTCKGKESIIDEESDLSETNNRLGSDDNSAKIICNEEAHENIDTHKQSNNNTIQTNVMKEKYRSSVELNDVDFETFIMDNFVAFSGKQNFIQWVDETENQFRKYRIGKSLRFEAIYLLVEGDAKHKYLKHYKEIQSIEDFYVFLSTYYDCSNETSNQPKLSQTNNTNANDSSILYKNRSVKDTNHSMIYESTIKVNHGTTNSVGERPVDKSNIALDSSVNFTLDSTLNDLRKAIVGNFIKNPKVFKGGKDDVKKWLEEIEHLFDIAQIPESTRLSLISYSLRGDALDWFRNNRSSFCSWTVFVQDLKKAFTSSFHEEIAFKKLETYSQGENQSVQNFYNEVIKLCKEADSAMNESAKLKNLLNKVKPSIQYEVRKKKPKSISEFLDYAKEAEELIQLTDMTINNLSINSNARTIQKQTYPLGSEPSSSLNDLVSQPTNINSSNATQRYETNYQPRNDRNVRFAPRSSSFSYSRTQPNRFHFNNNNNSTNTFTRPSQQRVYNTDKNNYNSFQKQSHTNAGKFGRTQYRTASAINFLSPSTEEENIEGSPAPTTCGRCNEFGHQVSACPNF